MDCVQAGRRLGYVDVGFAADADSNRLQLLTLGKVGLVRECNTDVRVVVGSGDGHGCVVGVYRERFAIVTEGLVVTTTDTRDLNVNVFHVTIS
jgi:hypothetical protein